MNHTPTPWIIDENEPTRIIGHGDKYGNESLLVAEICCGPSDERDTANAAFIVQAINSHDRLVEALREMVTMVKYLGKRESLREPVVYMEDCPYEPTTEGTIIARAEAALQMDIGGVTAKMDLGEAIIDECITALIAAERTFGTSEYPYNAGRVAACRDIYGDRQGLKQRVMSHPRAVESWKDHF
jgi:hypothetical protein